MRLTLRERGRGEAVLVERGGLGRRASRGFAWQLVRVCEERQSQLERVTGGLDAQSRPESRGDTKRR